MSEIERQLHLLHSELRASAEGAFTADELRQRASNQANRVNKIRTAVAGLATGLRYVIAAEEAGR